MESLNQNDRLALHNVIGKLHQCRTRQMLRVVFKFDILPLLNAHSALYAWTDSDFLTPRLIDCINIPKKEIASIQKFIKKDPLAGKLLTHSHPVIARDIEIPRNGSTHFIDPFQKPDPREKKGYGYFSTSQSGMITLALRDSNLGAGIHRRLPCDKAWTVRDVRIVEQLRPYLLMTIKTIVLMEELAKRQSMVDMLAGARTALAVVDQDSRISFANPAWRELFSDPSRQKLPEDLELLWEQEKKRCESPYEFDPSNSEDRIYRMTKGDFYLNITPLKGKGLEEIKPWLVQLKPLVNPDSGISTLMQKAGLTPREFETCLLLKKGIDAEEIASRMFISPHTVRTHVKRIHQKLGVHTRAQLIATLNNFEAHGSQGRFEQG